MSKREQQRKIKEEKQQAAKQRDKTKRLALKVFVFGVAPALIVFVLYTLFSQGPTYSPVEIADNDHIRGAANNPVSIVVYADFQCPDCATENQTMTQAWPSIRDKAHLIFRHFPVTNTHPHSWTASLYAEAAAKQGLFWEMHDYLFATQGVWFGMSSVESEFDGYAAELNLDLEQLHADMETDEVVAKLRNDLRGGNTSGVRSTPTVFINGRQLLNPSRSRIISTVNEEYEEAAGE
jgi:protein-disulfide isomerase